AGAVTRGGGGRDGRAIGRRSGRGGESGGTEPIGPAILAAECGEPVSVRAAVGEEDALGEAEAEIVPHLGDALQRRLARESGGAGIGGGGEIAEAEPRIIVARPDDPVEIDLDQSHDFSAPRRGNYRPASSRATPRSGRRGQPRPPRPPGHGRTLR